MPLRRSPAVRKPGRRLGSRVPRWLPYGVPRSRLCAGAEALVPMVRRARRAVCRRRRAPGLSCYEGVRLAVSTARTLSRTMSIVNDLADAWTPQAPSRATSLRSHTRLPGRRVLLPSRVTKIFVTARRDAALPEGSTASKAFRRHTPAVKHPAIPFASGREG